MKKEIILFWFLIVGWRIWLWFFFWIGWLRHKLRFYELRIQSIMPFKLNFANFFIWSLLFRGQQLRDITKIIIIFMIRRSRLYLSSDNIFINSQGIFAWFIPVKIAKDLIYHIAGGFPFVSQLILKLLYFLCLLLNSFFHIFHRQKLISDTIQLFLFFF